MPPDPVSELLRLVEADIADFEARMRAVVPAYRVGDRVEIYGELFHVSGFTQEGMPGYWLSGERREVLFWAMDQEGVLQPVVH
jgi:hypothetical protein